MLKKEFSMEFIDLNNVIPKWNRIAEPKNLRQFSNMMVLREFETKVNLVFQDFLNDKLFHLVLFDYELNEFTIL